MMMKPMSVVSQHKDATVHLAVKAVLTGEVPIHRLAQDLGIGVATIRRWVQDAIDQSHYRDTFTLLIEEVERLRRENAELRKLVTERPPRALPRSADRAGRPKLIDVDYGVAGIAAE